MTQRRKNDRFDIAIPVKSVETLYNSTFDDESVENSMKSILNMKFGRIYFKQDNPLQKSSMVKIGIDASGISRKLRNLNAVAMVVRSDELSEGNYRNLIVFSEIVDSQKADLNLQVFKSLAFHQSPLDRLFYI